ncbi:hypothetical protein [Pseudomonas sp. SED1]|uniref:hypothetical protein n=1 Tax=Pseudomonas sp. SED1 TaxID=3056845 RepID=UPI00296F7B8B|nr:hypothetical protein [Pseudomonas sp. SED1]MDY0833557.1 hypothetical protein [Pseudomonas sp. SED1]
MRTVDFQGTQLSSGQRRRLADQKRLTASMPNVIAQQVAETLQSLEKRKEQGVKPERIWFVERQETGTTSIVEWMGF